MYLTRRPWFLLVTSIGFLGLFWSALRVGTLAPAEFSFANGADIKSIDPAIVTGHPEGRIINAVFEGLYRNLPAHTLPGYQPDGDPNRMVPQPAMAERYDRSADGLTYTFHIRPSARWSDGSRVTAHDFVWSWKRFLHPDTANQYVYQLTSYVSGAKAFNTSQVGPGDRVEVELPDRLRPYDPFPTGTMLYGVVRRRIEAPRPAMEGLRRAEQDEKLAEWHRRCKFEVDIVPVVRNDDEPHSTPQIDWAAAGERRVFAKQDALADDMGGPLEGHHPTEECLHILPHFDSSVGIRAIDANTFEVRLDHPTAYFLELCGFYVLYPVHRPSVERFGYPAWTRPEHLVTNGPYSIAFRRIRDRIRLQKSPTYWNAKEVALNTIDALALSSQTTMLNMYLNGQLDWIDDPPQTAIPDLRQRSDWHGGVRLGTYFFRLNVNKPPLDNVQVRRALNQALNKQQICESVTRAGEVAARSLVPPGLSDYQAPLCDDYDVAAAQQLLADAGYAGGRGFPRLEILYNTSESHRTIAEVVQQQWNQNLGIHVDLRNREWKVYLDDTQSQKYEISRAAWIGDYPDPNTFLDMFVTQGPNNMTGWGNLRYDEALAGSQQELDPQRRLELLAEAERILMAELPILPIYFYASKNLVRADFSGFSENLLDVHPLHLLRRRR
ncbi:MAG: peptide ABC transporter substrate-binding protein [Planctomycetota bacterium]|nr:peptide ABC transporter substrate-binding protein [Planctomycetota bacterium]